MEEVYERANLYLVRRKHEIISENGFKDDDTIFLMAVFTITRTEYGFPREVNFSMSK
ncbi:hypothetical protein GOP47_0030944, partial [Adiantum capillus-veneris]